MQSTTINTSFSRMGRFGFSLLKSAVSFIECLPTTIAIKGFKP